MRIFLIRHGETALQAEKRYQGTTDAPLSPRGRTRLKQAPFSPDRVYVTPLVRTRETAAILFPASVQIEVPDLREMDFGAFEGRNYMEMEHDPDYRAWVDGMCLGKCPGGESKAEFCSRVCAAFSALLEGGEREEPVVIVAHGGTQMAVMERFSAEKKDYWSWQLPSGQGYLLETEEQTGDLRLRVLDVLDFTGE